ncbi:MAG: hypothetical protein ABIH00_06505 [Armatimonadota bacterium]
MKKVLIALIAIVFMATAAFAGTTDTQTVYYEIDAINEIVMGSDTTLTVNAANAGSEPTMKTSTTLYYSVTTNETGKKITGSINANMPSGTTLNAYMAEAPGNGETLGEIALSTTAADLVSSFEKTVDANMNYFMELISTVAAGLPADGSRVVTFTLTDT